MSFRQISLLSFLIFTGVLFAIHWYKDAPANYSTSQQGSIAHRITIPAEKTRKLKQKTKSTRFPKETELLAQETTELTRKTVFPFIDLPQQTLRERIQSLNRSLEEIKGLQNQIRLIIGSEIRLESDENIILEELSLHDVSLMILLQRMVVNRKLAFIVREDGIIEFTSIYNPELNENNKPDDDNSADPFNDYH